MTNTVEYIREFLKNNNIDFILINSTNKFLVEYNTLDENSRYILTGFSGSTGDALVSKDKIYLFVDGRYHIQADLEVDHSVVTVVKLATGQTFLEEIAARIDESSTFAIVAEKNSQSRIEAFEKALEKKNVNLILLDKDPLDRESEIKSNSFVDIPLKYTGMSVDEKVKAVCANLNENEAILVTNLEEVSYLFNKRDFSRPSGVCAKSTTT